MLKATKFLFLSLLLAICTSSLSVNAETITLFAETAPSSFYNDAAGEYLITPTKSDLSSDTQLVYRVGKGKNNAKDTDEAKGTGSVEGGTVDTKIADQPAGGLSATMKPDTKNIRSSGSDSVVLNSAKAALSKFQDEINLIGNIICAVLMVMCFITFAINLGRLSANATNALLKHEVWMDIAKNLVTAAGIGGSRYFTYVLLSIVLGS